MVFVDIFGSSTVALPNEKTGAATGVTVAAAGAGIAVKLEIPVMGLEPKDGMDVEATDVVVLVLMLVSLLAPKLNSGTDDVGGETGATGDTILAELTAFGSEDEIAGDTPPQTAGIAGAIDTTASGLFGEKAKPPLR